MNCAVEMASCGMIHIPSFMKIGTGVRAILRFCLGNLRDCNVAITDGGGLEGLSFRDLDTKYLYHKDWFRHSNVVRG
jgi:hypothetical protein